MSKDKKIIRFDHKIESFFKWPISYLSIIGFLTIFSYIYDLNFSRENNVPFQSKLSILYSVTFIMACILTFLVLFFTKRYFMREVINFSHYYGEAHTAIMNQFKIPYAIIDVSGKIVWNNSEFENVLDNKKCVGSRIDSIIPTYNKNVFSTDIIKDTELEINNKRYKITVEKIFIQEDQRKTLHKRILEEQELYAMYLFDVSSEHELFIKYNNEKPVVASIYVDNFEEVINSIEDVRRPILVALIDRTINKFAKDNNAIYKKFEKDKYIVIVQRKNLESMKESKFDLLDAVRSISIGNEMSVTLSIGVGVSDEFFSDSYAYAKKALDLALGRGGDQATIKHNEKLSFYGGKTRSVEKNTRVKARVKSHAFRELLLESDRVIVMGHKLQDMDSLGAAIGVSACAKHFNKEVHIILDKVTTSVKALHDQFISQEDVPRNLFIKNMDALSYITDDTLLVVVDVNRPSYTEYQDILQHVNKIVVFDHHRTSAESIDNTLISYVETYASSTCEIVAEIIQYISDKIKLTPLEADALFAGISVDTKNFADKAGVKTFEAAAFLRRSGADVVRVRKLFKNDMASYKAKATAVRDAEIYRENMAITVCPSDIVDPNLVGAQAADELLNISGIKASFVMTDVDGTIYISARSLDELNVQLDRKRVV